MLHFFCFKCIHVYIFGGNVQGCQILYKDKNYHRKYSPVAIIYDTGSWPSKMEKRIITMTG